MRAERSQPLHSPSTSCGRTKNSDYKIIWLVLIGMMPLLGGALYLAFGNKAPAKRMRQRMQAVERQHTADLAQQPGQTDASTPPAGTEPVYFGVRAVPRMEKLHGKILPLR